MLPKIELVVDVDVVAMSPLVRGMLMAVSYANTEGGISLTASGAMNRNLCTGPPFTSMAEAEMTAEAWAIKSDFRHDIIRPLCWLGLLREDCVGLNILQDGTYHKTPLWAACLKLESDTQPEITLH